MPSEQDEKMVDRISRNELYREIIEGFVGAYNRFDIEGMLLNVSLDVIFENKSGDRVDLHTEGIGELRRQAEDSRLFFVRRKQAITGMRFRDDEAEVDIVFSGTLAIDLPGGIRAGDKIEFKDKSIFRFMDDKIIALTDIA